MTKSKRSSSRTGLSIGASSILVIFVLLCLVTFAVLSLVSATADKALSDKNLEHITAYYAAETTAYEKLAKIDAVLAQNIDYSVSDDALYFDRCEAALADEGFAVLRTNDNFFIDYAVAVNDIQNLSVRILVRSSAQRTVDEMQPFSDRQPGYYSIESWALVGEGDWQPSDELPVYGAGGALPAM